MKNGLLVLFAAMLFLASCDYKYDYKLPDYSGYIRPSIYYYVDISSAMDSVIDADLDSAGIDPGPVARSYLLEIVEKDSQGDSLRTQYLNSWDLQTQSNHLNSTPGTAGIEVALIVPGIDADDHTFPVYKYTFSFVLEPENPDSLFQNNFVLSPSMPYVRTKYPLDVSGLSSAYYVENRMDEVIYSDFAGEGLRYNSQGGSGYDVALTERDGTGKVLRQDTLSGWSVSMDHTVVKSAAGTTDVELSLIAKSTDAAGHSFPVFKYTFAPQPVRPGNTTGIILIPSMPYTRTKYPLDVSGLSSAYYVENRMSRMITGDVVSAGYTYSSHEYEIVEKDKAGKVLATRKLGNGNDYDPKTISSAPGTVSVTVSVISYAWAGAKNFPLYKYMFSPQPVSPGKTTVVVLSSSGHYDRKRL